MPVTTVSILVPVHNAVATVGEALQRLAQADLGHPSIRREIIVVDDGSTDGTSDRVRDAATMGAVRASFQPEHLGQGAAISTGLAMASGQIVIIADATLAYEPAECDRLLAPILSGQADVVYGSRYAATTRQAPHLWDRLTDQLLTAVSNGLTNVVLSDVTTSFQAFRADVVRGAVLRADGPGVAGELAALFAARQCRIFEVPVSHRTGPARPVAARLFEGLSTLTMMARCRLRSWQLEPVTPHAPFQEVAEPVTRNVRLTRLVRPIDLMPMPVGRRCDRSCGLTDPPPATRASIAPQGSRRNVPCAESTENRN